MHRTIYASRRQLAVTSGDLNIFFGRTIADQQISYVIELSGCLDMYRLDSSVSELMKQVPILQSRIETNGVHVKRTQSSDLECKILFVEQPKDAQHEILRFISTPCDPESEIPIKLLVVRSSGIDTLCVKIDHVVSDAGGLKYLLYLLSDAYTNGEITLPINQNRHMRQIFHRFPVYDIIRKTLHARISRPGVSLLRGPVHGEPFIEHIKLEPNMFKRLYIKAKGSNVTINDLLLTAVYKAIFSYPAVQPGSAYPIMVPVDMRRYLEFDKRGVAANLSSSVYPTLEKIENESFTDTLHRVKDYMDTCKNDTPGLGIAILMSAGAVLDGKRMKTMYEMAASHESGFINLTNFGIIDEKLLRFDKTAVNRVYGVGPVENAPALLIAVSTFKETLNLVVQGYDKQKFQPFVKDFLQKMLRELSDYIDI